jgi:hypothetical protein
MKNNIYLRSYVTQFFLKLKMFGTNLVEKIKTRILCSITFFGNRAIYEIMWKNCVEPDRSHMAI